MISMYEKIRLKDGRTGFVVDYLGEDYVIDIDLPDGSCDTKIVKASEVQEH